MRYNELLLAGGSWENPRRAGKFKGTDVKDYMRDELSGNSALLLHQGGPSYRLSQARHLPEKSAKAVMPAKRISLFRRVRIAGVRAHTA